MRSTSVSFPFLSPSMSKTVLCWVLLLGFGCVGRPVLAARPATASLSALLSPPLIGTWTGQLAIPGRTLVLNLTIAEEAGHFSAVLDIPLAHLTNQHMQVTQHHDTLAFFDPVMDARYRAVRSPDGTVLVGQWQQPGFSTALLLARPAPVRAQLTTKWRSGMLANSLPVGPWEYYQYSAAGVRQVGWVYDHSAGRLLLAPPEPQACEVELGPGHWDYVVLNRTPWFIGGAEQLALYTATLQYPAVAQRKKMVGKVTVSFVIDTLGHVSGHRVVRGIGSECDEEALRVARAIPGTWTPGRLGTRAVSVRHYQVFNFRLP